MGIVIQTTRHYSLILTTKHGGTAKVYRKFECKDFDATILVAEPLNPCSLSPNRIKFSEELFHWGTRGYMLHQHEALFCTPEITTTHFAKPGHSGSGLYDKDGNLVGMCVKYIPGRNHCICLRLEVLNPFIDETIRKVEKEYVTKR